MTRDYLKHYKQQNNNEELDEVDKAWAEAEKPEVENALEKHPVMKWFLIIAGGSLAIFCVACLVVRAINGEFSSSREVTTNKIKENNYSNQTETNLDNSEDSANPDYNTNPEITTNNYNSQELQPAYYNTNETAIGESSNIIDSSQDNVVNTYEAPKTMTCTYRKLYGEKTPTELANESYMVKYYYDKYVEAERHSQEIATMYANSTSDSSRQKITQAEFARSKAYALYEKELNEKKAEYEDMLNECQ